MTVKHDCSGKIWGTYHDVSGRVYKCARPATVERDGKWYCWQHDPERVRADKEKRLAADRAELDRHHAMYARRARNARLAELVTPELASLLCDLAAGCDHSAWLAAEKGWAMAARIRAALEGNDQER